MNVTDKHRAAALALGADLGVLSWASDERIAAKIAENVPDHTALIESMVKELSDETKAWTERIEDALSLARAAGFAKERE